METILVAGATGYLGQFILKELNKQGYKSIAIARNRDRLQDLPVDKVIEAEVTLPSSLKGTLTGVDCVISTVGITRQKTYGPVEFFLTVMTMDIVAPLSGQHKLNEYYRENVK